MVCSNAKCTKMYSLSEGTQSDNGKACDSGKLDQTTNPTVCRLAEKSLNKLPVSCTQNSDCKGNMGGQTKCQCTWDGTAYCHLFDGDPSYYNMRQAYAGLWFKGFWYYKFEAEHYPLLQGTVPSCVQNAYPDFKEYKKGEPYQSDSELFGSILEIKLIDVLITLILLNFQV